MAASPSGFALRLNGSSCLGQEVDCGTTVAPYRVCCPAGSFCPSQYNINCCPSADNCTALLIENPRCANGTWDLYDNGGFFCCLKGLFGYAARVTDSNGCGSEGYILKSGEVRLPLIKAGQATSPASSTASATSSSLISSPPSSTPPSSAVDPAQSMSTGAKIGIGVGVGSGALALLLVAWIVYRHGKKNSETGKAPDTVHPMVSDTGSKHPQYRQELEGKQIAAELDHRYPVELDGHPR
ncbi:hypothetical protein B0H67DRAFT_348209 [Lasiosphaeris hirsuta]|uniref:Uncharacterized protein n=1 Tax=Lasiosphaeris hirsuta TaxID=260670 RepID=A0AA39ZVB9_9PEZI|nr:hypothetical protein B0H67DRAFT_348209 [Lasiosphaeris hirsuta]